MGSPSQSSISSRVQLASEHDEELVENASEAELTEEARRWYGWRLEYGLLAAAIFLSTGFAFAFFYFDIDYAELTTYGYIGLFFISLISAASIVMPMPGAAAITGAGALLDPILGIPVPVIVGLVAGPAEAIGELTGYAAGYGGSRLLRERSFYPRVKVWMERRGILTMFVLSSFPNPFVDVAGLAAGIPSSLYRLSRHRGRLNGSSRLPGWRRPGAPTFPPCPALP